MSDLLQTSHVRKEFCPEHIPMPIFSYSYSHLLATGNDMFNSLEHIKKCQHVLNRLATVWQHTKTC